MYQHLLVSDVCAINKKWKKADMRKYSWKNANVNLVKN